MCRGEGQKKRERKTPAVSMLSAEPGAELDFMTLRSDGAESESWLLKGAPADTEF